MALYKLRTYTLCVGSRARLAPACTGGIDDSSVQQLDARHVYSWRDIRWQHRYKDITSVSPQGRFLLDYT